MERLRQANSKEAQRQKLAAKARRVGTHAPCFAGGAPASHPVYRMRTLQLFDSCLARLKGCRAALLVSLRAAKVSSLSPPSVCWAPYCKSGSYDSLHSQAAYFVGPGSYFDKHFRWNCSDGKVAGVSSEDVLSQLKKVQIESYFNKVDENTKAVEIKKESGSKLHPLDGKAVKGRGKAIYYVDKGQKRFIPDWDTFLQVSISQYFKSTNLLVMRHPFSMIADAYS